MAQKFKTKLNINAEKQEQTTGDTMVLSGNTYFVNPINYLTDVSANYGKHSLVSRSFVTGITSTISGGTGTITGATNLGGVGLYTSILNKNLQFKGLVAGSNITLTPSSTGITIASTGGGGSGTITGGTNGLSTFGQNIGLGGILTGSTDITSLNGSQFRIFSYSNFNSFPESDLTISPSQAYFRHYVSNFVNSQILGGGIGSNAFAKVLANDSGTETSLYIESNGKAKISSAVAGFSGLTYNADYSTNFAKFSIVDKNYVTGYTNTNNVSKTLFNTYTGTTAPSQFQSHSSIVTYTGTTVPTTYKTIASFNSYSGTTNGRLNTIETNYVSGVTNGLTKSGTVIQLGGSLTNSLTTISGSTGGVKVSSFNIGSGFNNTIYSVVIQPDGKILVGGVFTTFTGATQNRLIRLNSNGSVDSTFNIGTGFNNLVESVVLQPDGKILVGGSFTTYTGTTYNRLIRLNSNGSVDSTFNIGSGFNGTTVTRVLLQPDGKVLVGGDFTTFTGTSANRFIRLNANGTKDSTFSIGTAFNGIVRSIGIQSDNKILVGGDYTTFTGSTNNHIIRLNTNGSKDTTFSVGTAFGSSTLIAPYAITVQTDGKILLGGTFTTFTGSTNNFIIRLNSNGSKDSTFNLGTAFNSDILFIAINNDNKILLAGDFTTFTGTSANRFIRLNTDGTKDSTFSIGTGFNAVSQGTQTIAFSANGEIFVGGDYSTYNGASQNRLIQLTNDSHLVISNPAAIRYGADYSNVFNDRNLVDRGYVRTNFTSITNGITGATNLGVGSTLFTSVAANKIQLKSLAAGSNVTLSTTSTGVTITAIGTLTGATNGLTLKGRNLALGGTLTGLTTTISGGTIVNSDPTFSVGTGFNNTVNLIILQPDGKILVGGSFTTFTGSTAKELIRLNANGTKDTTFNIGSGFSPAFSNVYTIALQSDGKILVGGNFTGFTGTSSTGIIRLNSNGTKDSTFNIGAGFTVGSFYNSIPIIESIIVQPDNKILVGGVFSGFTGTTINNLTRLNSNGSRDTSFNIGSGVNGGFNGPIISMALQPDGKILAGGTYTAFTGATAGGFIRLNSNGSKDSTFNIGIGFAVNNYPNAIVVQPDNKILLGGKIDTFTGSTFHHMIRLNSNGSRDTSFSIGSGFAGGGAGTYIIGLALQSDGKIIAVGDFSTFTGTSQVSIIRLNSNGKKDTTFNILNGFNADAFYASIQPDNKILIGGQFTTYNGVTANRIIRLIEYKDLIVQNLIGIKYASDYSSAYTIRSLVDKGYVTGLTNTAITVTGATNLGFGNGLFTSLSNKKIQIKSLVAGANITLTPTSTGITITNSSVSGFKYVVLQVKSSTVITTGNKGNVVIPYSGTITKWYLNTDVNASVTLNLWKRNGANPNAGDNITGSAPPTMTASNYATSSTLTGWTTAVTAGDKMELYVAANDLADYIQILVEIAT